MLLLRIPKDSVFALAALVVAPFTRRFQRQCALCHEAHCVFLRQKTKVNGKALLPTYDVELESMT